MKCADDMGNMDCIENNASNNSSVVAMCIRYHRNTFSGPLDQLPPPPPPYTRTLSLSASVISQV
jgi:hypothetical protein